MSKRKKSALTYASAGIDYDIMDPFKRLAQSKAKSTADNLRLFRMNEVTASRGDSAYVWEEPDAYKAFVTEGLGTKNLVADATRRFTGKTYYDTVAQDTVAMIVNDLIVVSAKPQVINAYFAVGNSQWFADEERVADLVNGWQKATNLSGAVWGGGETTTLTGIIEPDTIDLSGSAVGIIKPKSRLTLGNKLKPGDAIFWIESNGIHANGLTLARVIASKLPKGYATTLPDGKYYGETLLYPTHIYAKLINDLFESGIDIHYMVNVTGHGWRKIMRADRKLTYILSSIPDPHPLFQFIQDHSQNTDTEMYATFNMGAGFIIFIPEENVSLAKKITAEKYGWKSGRVGYVEEGPKQVIIRPKNIVYKKDSLGVR